MSTNMVDFDTLGAMTRASLRIKVFSLAYIRIINILYDWDKPNNLPNNFPSHIGFLRYLWVLISLLGPSGL